MFLNHHSSFCVRVHVRIWSSSSCWMAMAGGNPARSGARQLVVRDAEVHRQAVAAAGRDMVIREAGEVLELLDFLLRLAGLDLRLHVREQRGKVIAKLQ